MNFVAIKPENINGDQQVVILGEAAKDLVKRHSLKKDLVLKGLIIGSCLVTLQVQDLLESKVVFSIEEKSSLPEIPKIVAIVAISRPQTLKKILELAATFGVSELYFFRAYKSDKSYLNSSLYKLDSYEDYTIKGVEQGGLGILPKVNIHKHDLNFIQEILPKVIENIDNRFVADTAELKPANFAAKKGGVAVAFGPEAGFTRQEISELVDLNFIPVSLGPAMLRLETAFSCAVSQCLINC